MREKPLILVADEMPRNTEILTDLLSGEGYEIASAHSGSDTLRLSRQILPDLILLDVLMPDIDGFEVCMKLKADSDLRDIPVVFITTRMDTSDIIAGFEAGGADYISKPFQSRELLARIKTQISLRRANREILELEKRNAVFATAVTANHELNQPLMVLQGSVEMLLAGLGEANLTEQQRRHINRIKQSMDVISGILASMRDAGKVEFEDYTDDTQMVVLSKGKEE